MSIARLGILFILVGLALLVSVVSLAAILVILGQRSLPIHTSNNCIACATHFTDLPDIPILYDIADIRGR